MIGANSRMGNSDLNGMNKQQQLALDLPLVSGSDRDDLVVTPSNAQAVAFVDAWPRWPGPIAILAGPVGVGKTHLAAIWAQNANAEFLKPSSPNDLPVPEHANFVIEDITANNFDPVWLFHIVNLVQASKGSLLLTSRQWPSDWGIQLPDLLSRMKLAHLVELGEPDDDLLRGTLMKLFSDKQLTVDLSVIDFLVIRMERSLASAQKLVFQIDQLSLASQRPVTKPLVAEALNIFEKT